ncbi:MAG: hypothetical protein C5S47_01990 [Candidatus Methanogasteraceae archaeon]|nr:MAG: hypothetical protein C5S47_01990 [ANME-2 cluster archaeon]
MSGYQAWVAPESITYTWENTKREGGNMKQIRIFAIVLILALAVAFSGCVDSDSDSSPDSVSEKPATDLPGDGGSAGNYLDLIDVDSLHYRATVSSDEADETVFEEWRKKSGDVYLFKLVMYEADAADSSLTIVQNSGGMYMISESDGNAIKYGECSNDNIGLMNPFWAYGYYADDSVWEDDWIADKDVTCLGRKAIKLDYGKLWTFYKALAPEEVHPEKADLIVDKETGFTLLLDWKWSSNDGKTESMRYEVTEFDLNKDLPDSTFEIPSEIEVVDLTALADEAGATAESPPVPE